MLKIDIKKFLRDISVKKIIYISGVIGLLLILLSSTFQSSEPAEVIDEEFDYCSMIEEKLEEILPEIASVGKVSVMVTAKNYGQIVLAKDTSPDGDETIVLNQKGGGEDAKIIEEMYPAIEGVVIAADGGGKSKVKEDLTEAVTALLGVDAHKVKVYERTMK